MAQYARVNVSPGPLASGLLPVAGWAYGGARVLAPRFSAEADCFSSAGQNHPGFTGAATIIDVIAAG